MRHATLTTFALLLCLALAISADAATNLTKTSYLTNATGTINWNSITATDNGPFTCAVPGGANPQAYITQIGHTWVVTLTRSNSSGKVTPLQITNAGTIDSTVTITTVAGPGGPTPPAFPSTLYDLHVAQSIAAGVESLSFQGGDASHNACIHATGTKSKN